MEGLKCNVAGQRKNNGGLPWEGRHCRTPWAEALEEQHQAKGRCERLVLRVVGDRFLGPGVVALADDLKRLGGLVVDAAGDQAVLGLEIDGFARVRLEEARSIARCQRHFAGGRSERQLADEPVGVPELAVSSDTKATDRTVPTADAIELQGGADALAPITRAGEGE